MIKGLLEGSQDIFLWLKSITVNSSFCFCFKKLSKILTQVESGLFVWPYNQALAIKKIWVNCTILKIRTFAP